MAAYRISRGGRESRWEPLPRHLVCFLPLVLPPLLLASWPLLPLDRWTVARGGVASPCCRRRCCRSAGLCCRSAGGRWRGGERHVFSPPRAAAALLPVGWPLPLVGRWTVARGGVARVFSPPCCHRCCRPARLCCRSAGGRWPWGEWHASSLLPVLQPRGKENRVRRGRRAVAVLRGRRPATGREGRSARREEGAGWSARWCGADASGCMLWLWPMAHGGLVKIGEHGL